MLDKGDLSKIEKRIKKDISDNNTKYFKFLATKLDLESYPTRDDLRKSTNKILDTLDKIYGVVKKNDEEQAVIGHSVKNHEARIVKVEKVVFSN